MTDTLIQKVDLAIADLTSQGGRLTEEQSNMFIRTVTDAPTIIRDVRSVRMTSHTAKYNKIGFGSRVLRVARQDRTGLGRSPTEAERVAPDLGQIELTNKEYIAEVNLGYEVLEENIERGNLTETILTLLAERVALDLEELILKGDSATVGDDYLASANGVLKLIDSAGAQSHVVDGTGVGITSNLFNSAIKSMPTKYRRDKASMRFYVQHDLEQDYRNVVSQRGTSLGDAILTGTQALPVFGVPMRGVATMPDNTALFLDPRNILFGMFRDITLEADKNIRSREWIFVLTTRVGVAIEEVDAAVKIENINQ